MKRGSVGIFFRKDNWQLILLFPKQFIQSLGSVRKTGSCLVQDNKCWWVAEGVLTPGIACQAQRQVLKRDLRPASVSWQG